MKAFLVVFGVFAALSCGKLFSKSGTENETRPVVRMPTGSTRPAACPQQQTVMDLLTDIEKCEAKVKDCEEPVATAARTVAAHADNPTARVVVRYLDTTCADDGPVIEPVPSTKCFGGQLCLDDDGQRILAKNIASYEAWVQHVKDCERK